MAFGAFWGTWGAALPAVRDRAAVTATELGLALLLIGVGALPAMAVGGRLVDRMGGRAVGGALIGLAAVGLAIPLLAVGPVSLAVCLTLVGAASGAADVGANAIAGAAGRALARPVLTRAHGVFSASVVAGSVVTGGSRALGLGVVPAFVVVVVLAVAAAMMLRAVPPAPRADPPIRPGRGAGPGIRVALVLAGLTGALALAVENAHQSWGAVFLSDELHVAAGLTALAPALFAGVTALTRFALGAFPRIPPGPTLTVGAVVAAAGTGLLAAAPSLMVASAGLALAASGTAVLFPTLLTAALRDVPADLRGRATSMVAGTAYLGFVLGPVLVGAVAGAAGLRVALTAVAGVAVLAGLTLGPVAGWSAPRAGPGGPSTVPAGAGTPARSDVDGLPGGA